MTARLVTVAGCWLVVAVAWRVRPEGGHGVGPSGGRAGPWLRRRPVDAATSVPELVDLLRSAIAAGLPVAAAFAVVAPRAPPPLRPHLVRAVAQHRRGVPFAEVLDRLGPVLGADGVEVLAVLAEGARGGGPVLPVLERLSASLRDRRRRAAQEAARRLPVAMLFPLVLCVLPAAVLLAVVPVFLVSLGALSP